MQLKFILNNNTNLFCTILNQNNIIKYQRITKDQYYIDLIINNIYISLNELSILIKQLQNIMKNKELISNIEIYDDNGFLIFHSLEEQLIYQDIQLKYNKLFFYDDIYNDQLVLQIIFINNYLNKTNEVL